MVSELESVSATSYDQSGLAVNIRNEGAPKWDIPIEPNKGNNLAYTEELAILFTAFWEVIWYWYVSSLTATVAQEDEWVDW